MERFTESFAFELALRLHVRRFDRARGTQRRPENVSLDVRAILEVLAAARIGLAGHQELFEPLGLPQAVDVHDDLEDRLRLELGGTVHLAVQPGDVPREIAESIRNR